jgi:hypothetical protein
MWIALSLAGMVLMATMLLLLVHIGRMPFGQMRLEPPQVLFYLFVAATPLNFIYLKFTDYSLRMPMKAVPWIVGTALVCFVGNLCCLKAMYLAPNPGYQTAIESAKMVLVTLASVALFSSHFSPMKGLGVLCCTIGVALICLCK